MSKKFERNVKAIQKVTGSTKAEARALAKSSRSVRLKKKRLVLRGPNREVIGTLVMTDGTLHIQFPHGVKVKHSPEDGSVTAKIRPSKAKKKAKENGVDATGKGG